MMGGGRWFPWCMALASLVCRSPHATAEEVGGPAPAAQVRVLSATSGTSVVTVRATPAAVIEDRTPGSKPVGDAQGPAAKGKTFADEVTLFLKGFVVSRPASIDVDDPLVSTVRLLPEAGGTTIVVFVRQPVAYTAARPNPIGDVEIRVEGQVKPIEFAGVSPRGRPRYVQPKGTPPSNEVAVDAASLHYEQEGDILVAKGGVTLTRGNMMLSADEVLYDKKTSAVDAHGHVVMSDPEATVEGDAAHLNLDDEVGWIDAADADMHRTEYRLRCDRLVKRGGPLYSVADGIFTTCGCGGLEKPTWSIKAGQADVELDGQGEVRDATLRVKDVPVFYLPYFIFPANTDRESGLLAPVIGNSNRRGFWYTQPFFWDIDKSQDVTAAVDYESKARVGFLADYRYRLSGHSGGHFETAYFNESIGGINRGTTTGTGTAAEPPENRFAIQGHQLQWLGTNTRLFLDMLAVSDDTFLKDIRNFPLTGRHNQFLRFTTNRAGGITEWDDGYLKTDTSYFQDLEGQQNIALQQLPRAEITHGLSLQDWLQARLSGQVENFQRNQGFDGLRGDLSPELRLPFHMGPWVSGSLSALGHETAYHLVDNQQVGLYEDTRKLDTVPESEFPGLAHNQNRAVGEFRAKIGTEISRVFDFPYLGLEKIRHTIEPEVQYLYVPDVGTQRHLGRVASPTASNFNATTQVLSSGTVFDELDAIRHRDFLSYGVTTRLFGRGAPTPAVHPQTQAQAQAHESLTGDDEEDEDDEGPPEPTPETEQQKDEAEPTSATSGEEPILPSARELLRLSVLRGNDFSRRISPDSHGSDVDLGLRASPLDYLALTYNTTIDFEQGRSVGQQVGLSFRDPSWSPSAAHILQNATTVAISYNFVANENERGLTPAQAQLFPAGGEVKEIAGIAYLALGQYLGLFFRGRYSLTDAPASGTQAAITPHFLERSYFVRLLSRCNCWVLDVGYSDQFNPNDRSLRIQFTLVGLGSYGKSGRGMPLIGVAPGAYPSLGRYGGGMY